MLFNGKLSMSIKVVKDFSPQREKLTTIKIVGHYLNQGNEFNINNKGTNQNHVTPD